MAGEWRQNPVNMNLIHWLEFLWTTLNNSNSSASSTFKSTITVQRSILQSNKLYSIFDGTKTVEDWSNDCNKAVNNWSVAGLHHEHLVKWAWDDQKSDNQKIHTRLDTRLRRSVVISGIVPGSPLHIPDPQIMNQIIFNQCHSDQSCLQDSNVSIALSYLTSVQFIPTGQRAPDPLPN